MRKTVRINFIYSTSMDTSNTDIQFAETREERMYILKSDYSLSLMFHGSCCQDVSDTTSLTHVTSTKSLCIMPSREQEYTNNVCT